MKHSQQPALYVVSWVQAIWEYLRVCVRVCGVDLLIQTWFSIILKICIRSIPKEIWMICLSILAWGHLEWNRLFMGGFSRVIYWEYFSLPTSQYISIQIKSSFIDTDIEKHSVDTWILAVYLGLLILIETIAKVCKLIQVIPAHY